MGIGDFISDITPDVIEDAVEDGVEWVGNRVEDVGNWTADRLEDVGWESGADWVREQSRSLANRMGAEVGEMDLGQTEDKTKLIYGSASKINATADKLRAFEAAFESAGTGIKGLGSTDLKGATAEALRTAVATQPPKWFAASDATAKALGALESFADTVTWAQDQAQTAIDKWKQGTKASEGAAEAQRKRVDDYNKAVDHYNAQPSDKRDPKTLPPRPAATFDDPGKQLMKEAQDILAEARRQRNSAAETARSAVRAARDMAPKKPSYAEQVRDGAEEFQLMGDHFGGGIIKGTAGILNFVRSVNPMDPYNLTHPAEYATSLNSLAAGLVVAANDPVGTATTMVKDFMKDPSEGVGRLIPDLALTVATGGGGGAVKGVRLAEEAAEAARLRRLLDDAPDGTHRRPDGERLIDDTDPVDLATGRMFLPQTDVEIAGILPLLFTRRTESGTATGRFLGAAWSSTVDERLTVDAAGVLHITADGLLVPYPHPAPGVPTGPGRGRIRARLARETDGDYTITDPLTGLVRRFTAPAGAGPGPAVGSGAGPGTAPGSAAGPGTTSGTAPGGDGTAWLTTVTEPNGHSVTVDRAADGLPLALTHSAGHQLTLGTADGRIATLALTGAGPGGTDLPLMAYGYQDGELATVTRPSGAVTTFHYDERHRVVDWIDSNGCRYDYVYDDHDRVIAEGGAAGHIQITLAYGGPDPATGHRTTVLTTADGRVTRHVVGPGCQIVATTDALGHTTRFRHDPDGNLLSRTDPLGATHTFHHDQDGRMTAAVRPDGTELRFERDESGFPVQVVGPDGGRTRYAHDERGNRTEVTDPAGRTTRSRYDEAGRLTSVTDALGRTTWVVCDAAGRTVAVTDPRGATTRTERDGLGRPVRVTEPTGSVTELAWTPDGQLARRTAPDGAVQSWTYDGEGNCLSHTDASGAVTRYTYTDFDLPLTTTRPDGARYTFEHDRDLRLTRVTNAQGLSWSYSYDAVGNIVSETDFDGRTLHYRVDAAGRLAERVDALGGTIAFARDPLGQVLSKNVDGRITTYAHDRAGRLLEAVGPDGELRYQYDRCGRVRTELVDGRPIVYGYDELGRRVRRTTPTGHVTTYHYGDDGLPVRLTTGDRQVEFHHDAAGRELARVFGDTLTMTSTWDGAGRLDTHQVTAGRRTVTGRSYRYRADGRLTAITEHAGHADHRGDADQAGGAGHAGRAESGAPGGAPARRPSSRSRTFDLDPLGRITAVHAPGWTERYTYDDSGNQTDAHWPDRHPGGGATGRREYTGTRVTRAGGVRFEYDALGRVTLRQKARPSRKPDTWHYQWDTENRLTAVTTPDGTRWRYRHDPLGRRTAKERLAADGRTVAEEVRFTWDGLTLCEQTSHRPDDPHSVALTWDHRDVVPLAQTERVLTADQFQQEIDRRFFAVVTDLTGTPTELVDEHGTVAWHTRRTLWGSTSWSRDSVAYTPLRFPGQYDDPETGLHHNLFRHYDPETGRYTSPDPLGLGPAPNPVGYVDNPYDGCDPLGLAPRYTKEERERQRSVKAADGVIDRADGGRFRKHPDYHGDTMHGFTDERVLEILKNPDAVYQSTGGSGNLIFRQGEDVVITKGAGSEAGQAITAYGPSGVLGDSGATAVGNGAKATDAGRPITHDDIVQGRIPGKNGFMPPAVQIK
ncbi:putative T7SS-secreted protein [Streptomyces sp. NPDC090025]|uniref:putative T7SS-secreted protein n=1 Tax=Streptomyces sp. NPDC090025 TaxID=3365922 RepID=UPI003835527D